MSEIKVAPSVLAADPLCLAEEIATVKDAGADLLHLDIMDGHFVPNLTFGVEAARRMKQLGLPLDIHLMVDCLDWAISAFSGSAEYLTVHAEATPHLHRTLQYIKSLGLKSGVALNPSTPPDFLPFVADQVDLVLIMTVNPGWGGQAFIPEMVDKVSWVRRFIVERGLSAEIEVDGGVTAENARILREAGASILVAGSYVFKAAHRQAAISRLR